VTGPAEPQGDELPLERKSFLSLIPRRDVTRVVLLVLLLVVIVALQRRSGAIVKSISNGLFGSPPAESAPAEAKSSPRVRLAPPPAP
jgi:hypothetical protein